MRSPAAKNNPRNMVLERQRAENVCVFRPLPLLLKKAADEPAEKLRGDVPEKIAFTRAFL